MALVKMLRGGQVTLPAELRRELRLNEGDYLEAAVAEGVLTLKPVAVIDRARAWDELMAVVNRPKWKGPGPEPSEDELMEEVVEAVHETRRRHA